MDSTGTGSCSSSHASRSMRSPSPAARRGPGGSAQPPSIPTPPTPTPRPPDITAPSPPTGPGESIHSAHWWRTSGKLARRLGVDPMNPRDNARRGCGTTGAGATRVSSACGAHGQPRGELRKWSAWPALQQALQTEHMVSPAWELCN
jgi:hypothetical protein